MKNLKPLYRFQKNALTFLYLQLTHRDVTQWKGNTDSTNNH